MLQTETPEALGFDPSRWSHVLSLATSWTEQAIMPAMGFIAGRSFGTTGVQLFGRQRLNDDCGTIRDDAIFLTASLTKPVLIMGIMLLVERGELALSDKLGAILPLYDVPKKRGITIRHLMTHTSGLPDMLPQNEQLRREHGTLTKFVEGTAEVDLSFAPGYGVQYQSMGIAALGEVIRKITGKHYGQFLQEELFTPLEMESTVLGMPDSWEEGDEPTTNRIVEVRVPDEQTNELDWNWNSHYWRNFGAPWGGMLSSPGDLGRFCQMMLNNGRIFGRTENGQLLASATVQIATENQLECMQNVPAVDRRTRPWGLGWRLNWPNHPHTFSDLLSPETFGHYGATGTIMWVDPVRDLFAVVLTTQPLEGLDSHLSRFSNAIAAALL